MVLDKSVLNRMHIDGDGIHTPDNFGAVVWKCGDGPLTLLIPLGTLRDVYKKVDKTTFEELLKEYQAMQQDPDKRRKFFEKCDYYLSADKK